MYMCLSLFCIHHKQVYLVFNHIETVLANYNKIHICRSHIRTIKYLNSLLSIPLTSNLNQTPYHHITFGSL